MATLAMRSRHLLAGVTVLTIGALCTIGLATFQIADIRADVTRILDDRQADAPAHGPAGVDAGHDQNQSISARPTKDWKWIVGYSNPPRIRHASVQAIAARLAALHRNMLLTFTLSTGAAVVFVLLASRVFRSIRVIATELATGVQEVSTLTRPTAETTRGISSNSAAPSTVLDQVLHAAWDELPVAASEDANPAANKAPQDRTAAEASDVIPKNGSRPQDC
jgi:hypothetical protein